MKLFILFFALWMSSCGQRETYKLTILHVNDTHASHESSIKVDKVTGSTVTNGGEAQFAGVIAEERRINPNTLVIHAGDVMTGSAYTIVYKGIEASELMNMAGISVATLGNHEFDYGLKNAYDVLNIRDFPTVSANVFETDLEKPVVPPYIITNLGRKTLALIGLMVEDEVFAERLGDKGFIKVTSAMETLRNLLTEDEGIKSADHIILISHSGFEIDKQIARAFPGKFAAIIGGHSHTLLTEPVVIEGTPIVQLENNLKRVGRLDLSFKGKKMNIAYKQIPLSNTAYDTDVADYIAQRKVLVDETLGVKIGMLTGGDIEDMDIRRQSAPIGNFVIDTLYNLYKGQNIDFAVINSGSIRLALQQGDITLRNLFEIYPFDSIPVVVKLKGSYIRDMFSVSASRNWDEGGFLQISQGVSIYADSKRNIKRILINGQELDLNKEYTVLLTDWIYYGGDNYSMIESNASYNQFSGSYIRDILINIIKKEKMINAQEVNRSQRWFFEAEV
ncbi:MAG: bifunctional metallophosphatase/5'-nucleotidase [Brevinema sp.]